MKIHYNSPVILTYALLCSAVLLLGTLTNGFTTQVFFVVYRTSFTDPLQYFRLFSYILGHGDFNHFFGNLSMIILVGPMVEEKYGSEPLLLMIIFTAFIGGLSHILLFPGGALGASGIAFMLILLTPFTNMRKGAIPLTLILVAVIFIGRELLFAITIEDNVSRFGHVLGGMCGAAMGMFINKNKSS